MLYLHALSVGFERSRVYWVILSYEWAVNLSFQAHHCNLPQCGFHYQPRFVAKKVVVKDIQ